MAVTRMIKPNKLKFGVLKFFSSRHHLGTRTMHEALLRSGDAKIKEVVSAFQKLSLLSLRKITACRQGDPEAQGAYDLTVSMTCNPRFWSTDLITYMTFPGQYTAEGIFR